MKIWTTYESIQMQETSVKNQRIFLKIVKFLNFTFIIYFSGFRFSSSCRELKKFECNGFFCSCFVLNIFLRIFFLSVRIADNLLFMMLTIVRHSIINFFFISHKLQKKLSWKRVNVLSRLAFRNQAKSAFVPSR